MKRTGYRRFRRFRRASGPEVRPLPVGRLALAAGYLLGCFSGAWLGTTANMPITWLQSGLAGVAPSTDLLTELADCGTYGFGMLLASTSYLGFALVPLILTAKGFLSSCSITACLRGGTGELLPALLQILLPGLFLLPALFILGEFTIRRSVRLMAFRWSDQPLPPDGSEIRTLATAAVLLLLTAAIKTYVTPAILNWL